MKRLALLFWRFSKADLRLLWFALSHRDRPRWLRPAAFLLTLYAIAPFNFVIPVLGVVDDLVLVPLVLHFLLTLLPANVRNGGRGPVASG
ncbi:MAG: hypothetical protein H7315_14740 [Herminiimonas sp.]|nr:hypothetical protein [Herminiimonas sp.]